MGRSAAVFQLIEELPALWPGPWYTIFVSSDSM